jgi:hypothetical protein
VKFEGRLTYLYLDKLDLKFNAPQKPSPSLSAGSGSWNGHIQQLEQKQGQLQRAIADAIASGCKVPPFFSSRLCVIARANILI